MRRLLLLLAFLSLAAGSAKLTIEDVIKMERAGIPDAIIISKIQSSGTVFRLEVTDILAMKKQGVSDKVIEVMVATEINAGRPMATSTATASSTDPSPSETPEPLPGPRLEPEACSRDVAATLFRERKWDVASDVLFCVIEERRASQSEMPEMTRRLADALWEMGLHQSAVYYYVETVKAGPSASPHFEAAVARTIEISDELRDDRRLLQLLQDISPESLPPSVRADAGLFYGMLAYRKGDTDLGLRALRAVPRESRYYHRARYWIGVILALREDWASAIAEFEEARPGIPEQSQLAIARTFYGAERYRQALDAYRELRHPPQVELAWAMHKTYDYAGATKVVEAVVAEPEKTRRYEPEAYLIAGVAAHRRCHNLDADAAASAFFARYVEYQAKVKSFRKQASVRPPEQVWAFVEDFAISSEGRAATFMPDDLMRSIAEDGKVAKIRFHLGKIRSEQEKIRSMSPWRGSRVAAAVMDQMNGHRESLRKLGGRLVLREFEDREEQLDELFDEAKALRFHAQRNAVVMRRLSLRPSGGMVRSPDSELYWAFPGDAWRDALDEWVCEP